MHPLVPVPPTAALGHCPDPEEVPGLVAWALDGAVRTQELAPLLQSLAANPRARAAAFASLKAARAALTARLAGVMPALVAGVLAAPLGGFACVDTAVEARGLLLEVAGGESGAEEEVLAAVDAGVEAIRGRAWCAARVGPGLAACVAAL